MRGAVVEFRGGAVAVAKNLRHLASTRSLHARPRSGILNDIAAIDNRSPAFLEPLLTA
jgi:hypothetical protein